MLRARVAYRFALGRRNVNWFVEVLRILWNWVEKLVNGVKEVEKGRYSTFGLGKLFVFIAGLGIITMRRVNFQWMNIFWLDSQCRCMVLFHYNASKFFEKFTKSVSSN